MKLPENFTEKFILERVAVYKVGQQPSEKESHGPILDVLSKASDSLIILVAKSIIEQTWTIPLLELKEWKSSAEELREADMDNIDSFDLIPIPVHLKADCVSADFMVHTADSKVYRVRFTIRQTGTDQSWQSSVRLAQMKQIEELLTPFRSHKAGPLGTEGFEISSTVMYHLFTPGQLIDKDVWVANGAVIAQSAVLFPPVLIGKLVCIHENAVVGPGVILALDASIDQGCVLTQSIILRAHMGKNSMITNIPQAKDLLLLKKNR